MIKLGKPLVDAFGFDMRYPVKCAVVGEVGSVYSVVMGQLDIPVHAAIWEQVRWHVYEGVLE